MLHAGIFDGVDCCIHLHATTLEKYKFSTNASLAGFIYEKITFLGKASHAAVLPHEGINALNAFTLFQNGVSFLRETFEEKDCNRVHGIVLKGGQTVNSIPEKVVYECYIRSLNQKKLISLSDDVANVAVHCAKALHASVIVEKELGYMPFVPNLYLAKLAEKYMLDFCTEEELYRDEKSVASGDIGDLGMFIPTIQFGYTGFSGRIHGADLQIKDKYAVYYEPSYIVLKMVLDLLNNPIHLQKIKESFHPEMSISEYFKNCRN